MNKKITTTNIMHMPYSWCSLWKFIDVAIRAYAYRPLVYIPRYARNVN